MAGDGYRVGVLGATGLVGTTILELLADARLPGRRGGPLRLRALGRQEIEWNGSALDLPRAQRGLDPGPRPRPLLGRRRGQRRVDAALVEAGAVVVDNTSYWRMHDDVPLVVSEVNPEALDGHKGIVANPNCSTMQMVVALKPLLRRGRDRAPGRSPPTRRSPAPARRRSTSCCEQSHAVLARPASRAPRSTRTRSPSTPLAQAGSFADGDDHTDEERKLINETRKILGDEEIRVSATCVRVPVVTGHSEAVNVETQRAAQPRAGARAARRRARRHRRRRPRRRRATRWRSRPPARTTSSSAASAATPATSAPSTSGSSPTTCARAPRPTRCRSPSCWSSATCCVGSASSVA